MVGPTNAEGTLVWVVVVVVVVWQVDKGESGLRPGASGRVFIQIHSHTTYSMLRVQLYEILSQHLWSA